MRKLNDGLQSFVLKIMISNHQLVPEEEPAFSNLISVRVSLMISSGLPSGLIHFSMSSSGRVTGIWSWMNRISSHESGEQSSIICNMNCGNIRKHGYLIAASLA